MVARLFLRGDGRRANKRGEQFLMRARDDMRTDEFADFGGRFGPGVHGGFDAADVALSDDGDESAADGDGFDQRDVGGLDHGVAGFHAADVALGFNHSYCFVHNLFWLMVSVENLGKEKTSNIQHRTTNIQKRIQCRALTRRGWVLDVGRWMLDVHLINSTGVCGSRLQALPSSVSICTSSLKLGSTRTSSWSSVIAHGPPTFNFMWSPALT